MFCSVFSYPIVNYHKGGGEIVKWLVSPSVKGPSRFEPGLNCFFQKGGILSACYEFVSTSANDLFTKGLPCVIMSVIMHVKNP